MSSLTALENEIRLIISRNIIFPEDQLKIINMIKNGHITCNSGNFSLQMIEDRNLIFPQDVITLRNLIHTINSGDENFKCLMELFIASTKRDIENNHNHDIIEIDNNKYYKDPITYSEDNQIDGINIKLKKRPEYKKIYQDGLFLDQSEVLLNQLCSIASFRNKNSNDYALRIYFDSESLKILDKTKIRTSEIDLPTETNSKDDYDVLRNKLDRKVTKCGNEYLDKWNELFLNNTIADITYNILNVLKDKPYIEIAKIETNGKSVDIPKLIEKHVENDNRVINKTAKDVEKGTVVDSFLGFLRNMVGGASEIDHKEYSNMKSKYKYEKSKKIHQLLKN